MRIKSLELSGFKSFKDRTVIHFDPGTTGVVGPNGCGKSNIVDALLWVMGEMSAKQLRGSSMVDVIFMGSQNYEPAGLAEVSLTLENDGGPFPALWAQQSEIRLTRRLHRSGESEYLINRQQVRLRDIQEVFMDTGAGAKGFSIVEQGAIGRVVTAKPEDRKYLIEEAAGITKFKARKKESQRKLQATEQNLVRLEDILSEQRRYLNSLERQAQRAEKYRDLKKQVEEKELWMSSQKYTSIREQLEELEKKLSHFQETEATELKELSEKEVQLQKLKVDLAQRESLLQEKQSVYEGFRFKVEDQEKEIRELEFEAEQARRDQQMVDSVLSQHEARLQALKAEEERVQEKKTQWESQKPSFFTDYENGKEGFQKDQSEEISLDQKLQQVGEELLRATQRPSQLKSQIEGKQEQIQVQKLHRDKIENTLKVLEQQKEEWERKKVRALNKLEKARQLQLDIMKDAQIYEDNRDGLLRKKQDLYNQREDFKGKLVETSGRLYGLENLQENFEGFKEGVKKLMLWQSERKEKDLRPLLEVVEVSQKYELAMEVALGEGLQLLLSENTEKGLEALNYLKTNQAGRSQIFPKEMLPSSITLLEKKALKMEEGVEVFLEDVVKVSEKYRDFVSYFLSSLVVVDSLERAFELRKRFSDFTFITLDGESLNKEGVLSGGSPEPTESGFLRRSREIKILSEKRQEWSRKLSLIEEEISKVEAQLKQMEKELKTIHKLQGDKEVELAEYKKDLENTEESFSEIQERCHQIGRDFRIQEEVLKDLESEKIDSQRDLEEALAQQEVLGREKEELTRQLKALRLQLVENQRKIHEWDVKKATYNHQKESIEAQWTQVQKSLSELKTQMEEMEVNSQKNQKSFSLNYKQVEERKVGLESLIAQTNQAREASSAFASTFDKETQERRRLEESIFEKNRNLNEAKGQSNELQLKVDQERLQLQTLKERIKERYFMELEDVVHEYTQEWNMEEIEPEVNDLKEKLNRLGEVNLSALQEYDEVKKRYEFLEKQCADLVEAKEELKKVIERIHRICSKRFKETFEKVNEKFEKVFPTMFGGGKARLTLVENPEKGEMGIDIVAQPPGKNLQNVSLLSGGEKALTAVSLIFSIFLVRPSPFCLLDEVDAPLDDANVIRFNELVREMARCSQIIVVTHNKHTMKVNKKLYGVTMEEKGISKMVSVELDRAEKFAVTPGAHV